MKLYLLPLFILALTLFNQNSLALSALSSDQERLITMINSTDPAQVREAAKNIYERGETSESMFDHLAERLLQDYLNPEKDQIDAMAWLVVALGSSKNKRYHAVVNEVATQTLNTKLAKHAKKSLKKLTQDFGSPQYARGLISRPQWSKPSDGSESEYHPYLAKGKSSVFGQAFLTQRGGGVIKAAGRVITLDPATPTGNEWWLKTSNSWIYRDETPPLSLFHQSRRTATVDAEGRFKFDNIPAGKYYIRTEVTWYIRKNDIEGGLVGQLINVSEDSKQEIILSSFLRSVSP